MKASTLLALYKSNSSMALFCWARCTARRASPACCLWLNCAGLIPNPVSDLEVSVKTAFQMYRDRQDTLGPPPVEREEYVYARGKEEFVNDMVRVIRTKYRAEALYALAWFGDRRHAALVADALKDVDPEVRRVALVSFANLTHRQFQDTEAAITWWKENKDTFPKAAQAH